MFMVSTRSDHMSIKHAFLSIWSDFRKRPASIRPDVIWHFMVQDYSCLPLSTLHSSSDGKSVFLWRQIYFSLIAVLFVFFRLRRAKVDIATSSPT